MSALSNFAYNSFFTHTINVLTKVIVTFISVPVCSRMLPSVRISHVHEIIDCGYEIESETVAEWGHLRDKILTALGYSMN